MKRMVATIAALCMFVGVGAALTGPLRASRVASGSATPMGSRNEQLRTFGKLPLSFEPNVGQTDPRIRFLSRGAGYTLFVTQDQAVLSMREHLPRGGGSLPGPAESRATPGADDVLSMRLLGADPGASITGFGSLTGVANYFIGNDPNAWHTNIPTYSSVLERNVYPGVDLVYYGNQGGRL